MSEEKLHKLVSSRIPGLPLILVTFAVLEFGILMVCIALSSNQDIVRIHSPENELIYEDTYNLSHITEFKKVYGIENFRESGFVLTRIKTDKAFPTRSWIALSICIPLMLILFVAFVIKAFEDMFNPPQKQDPLDGRKAQPTEFEETKFEKLFSTLGRLNVYSLGSTVLIAAFLYWTIPDLIVYIGKIGYQTISELKWVILSIVLLGGIYLIIKLILAYRIKNEIVRHQAIIQQNRDALAMEMKRETKQLENRPD